MLITESQKIALDKYIAEKTILESIDKTVAGYEVRGLIKEGNEIKGEFKSYYGQWHSTSWTETGTPINAKNKFEEKIFQLPINQ